MIVELRDTSLQGAPSIPISRIELEAADDQPPHSFRLEYNPRSVGEKNTYGLTAEVRTADGRPLFITNKIYDVITRGNPRRVNIELTPTDLAGQLITNGGPLETQDEQTSSEPELIETVTVEDQPTASPDPANPATESAGGSGAAFLIILVVIAGFVWVLVARHKATHPSEPTENDESEEQNRN